jgi:ABC-2 type transport system ATP-binding protein
MGSGSKTMTETALLINNLNFSFTKQKVLDRVEITINSGDCTILLGPNGAGKSTLFSLITRLYDIENGQIRLDVFEIKQQTRQALSKLGVVFQQTTLDMDLTVLQNLRYHTALHGIAGELAKQRIQQELERMDMYDRRFEIVRQLNGGHRRRVEIARALLHRPAVLLLDEPTVGLDVASRKAIVEHVHTLAAEQNIAVFWATHLVDEIFPEDQVIIFHQGQVLVKGSVRQILEFTGMENINKAFLKLTQGAEQ